MFIALQLWLRKVFTAKEMCITCYCHDKKPQNVGKKPAHSLEHLGKADEQKADPQECIGGSDLPALDDIPSPLFLQYWSWYSKWVKVVSLSWRLGAHERSWGCRNNELALRRWGKCEDEDPAYELERGKWCWAGGRAWLLAVLKITEVAGGEDRKDYFVLVWDSSKGVRSPHHEATINPNLYKLVLIKSFSNST